MTTGEVDLLIIVSLIWLEVVDFSTTARHLHPREGITSQMDYSDLLRLFQSASLLLNGRAKKEQEVEADIKDLENKMWISDGTTSETGCLLRKKKRRRKHKLTWSMRTEKKEKDQTQISLRC